MVNWGFGFEANAADVALHLDDPQLPSRDDATGKAGAAGDVPRRWLEGHDLSELERTGLVHGRGSGCGLKGLAVDAANVDASSAC